MNGPEHYRRAEALLDSCQLPGRPDIDDLGRVVESYPSTEIPDTEPENTIGNALLAAQVHATLALAAATAVPTVVRYLGDEYSGSEWTGILR